ncbi:MAG: hypothetical protein EB168_11505, partial [Euryarchaeota archaeon]|nr:hypothetical protein [Euryarchaeota archaeon]
MDNAFLTGKIALDDLSDVTSPAPANNQYLRYNGANWAPADLDIDGAILFQGVVDATTDSAPASPSNGHMYINTGSGAAVGSWTGLTNVDSDQQLIWGSDQASWFAFGGKHDPGVVEVREGIAILVNDSDAARPTVSVDRDVLDTWYFTQDSVQEIIDAVGDSNHQLILGILNSLTELNQNKVDRAGDTMTGDLTLPQDPTNPLHAATKQYVDQEIAGLTFDSSTIDNLIGEVIDSDDLVHVAGDTMTGFLTLHSDPSDSMHAATKSYVDAQITALDSAMDSALDNKASATVDLTDVDSSGPSHGQILMYDSDAGQYTPVDIEQAGGGVAHWDSVPPETPFTNGQFWFNSITTSLYVWH